MNTDEFLEDAKKICKDENKQPVIMILQHNVSGGFSMMAVKNIDDKNILALLKATTESHAREMLSDHIARANAKIIDINDPKLKPLK